VNDLILLLLIAAGIWFWVDTLHARERAVDLCRTACQSRGVQLLDQTVALEHISVARDREGRLRLQRRYRFEFTEDGATRQSGTVVMLGATMQALEMPHNGARIYEQSDF
jgi:hypothetical protein